MPRPENFVIVKLSDILVSIFLLLTLLLRLTSLLHPYWLPGQSIRPTKSYHGEGVLMTFVILDVLTLSAVLLVRYFDLSPRFLYRREIAHRLFHDFTGCLLILFIWLTLTGLMGFDKWNCSPHACGYAFWLGVATAVQGCNTLILYLIVEINKKTIRSASWPMKMNPGLTPNISNDNVFSESGKDSISLSGKSKDIAEDVVGPVIVLEDNRRIRIESHYSAYSAGLDFYEQELPPTPIAH